MFLENGISDGLWGIRRACSFLWTPPGPTLGSWTHCATGLQISAQNWRPVKMQTSQTPRDDQEARADLREDKNLLKGRNKWAGFGASQKCRVNYRACKDAVGKWVLGGNVFIDFVPDKDKWLFHNRCATTQGRTLLLWRWLGNLWTCARNCVISAQQVLSH